MLRDPWLQHLWFDFGFWLQGLGLIDVEDDVCALFGVLGIGFRAFGVRFEKFWLQWDFVHPLWVSCALSLSLSLSLPLTLPLSLSPTSFSLALSLSRYIYLSLCRSPSQSIQTIIALSLRLSRFIALFFQVSA